MSDRGNLVLLRFALVFISFAAISNALAPEARCQPVSTSVPAPDTNSVSPSSPDQGSTTGTQKDKAPADRQSGSTSTSTPGSQLPAASGAANPPAPTAKPPAPPVENVLSGLESRFFVHAYSQDPVEQRLTRLEQFVFGKRGSGNPAARLARLKAVLRPLQAAAPNAKPGGLPTANTSVSTPSGTAGSAASPASSTGPGTTATPNATTTAGSSSPENSNQSVATAAIPSTTPPGSGSAEHFSWYHPTANTSSVESTNASANTAAPAKAKKEPSVIQVMNRGIDNYNAHRYHNAEDDFEECCAMAPGMSRAYTYLAVTKLQVGERREALDAFNTCYELDPFGEYGRYSKNCLIVLAGDEAIRKRGVVDSQKDLDKALNKINQQSGDEIARHNKAGYETSSSRYRMPYVSRNFSGYFSMDSQVQGRLALADAAKRAAETAESANNLKHLLATKRMPGDANLRALGTSLTTRYYGSETMNLAPYYIPREYPLQLKAIPKSIDSMKTTSRRTTHSGSAHSGSAKTKHQAIAKSKGGKSTGSVINLAKAKAKQQHRK